MCDCCDCRSHRQIVSLADLRASPTRTSCQRARARATSLYERLAALELDAHLHIHKENHVLFPAALRLAER
jgi:iron-sulfur cluster repair protein YtfE (RIC family)